MENRRTFLMQTAAAATGVLAAGQAAAPPDGKRIKVGVIGCGNVSRSYLPDLIEKPYIELVSVCDLITERAQDAARRCGISEWHPNIDAMLAGSPFDLLVNITSMPSHYPVSKKALDAGRHVWTEKPMALEVAQGRDLIDTATAKGVHLWVSPNVVTSPQFRFMAETLASGKLGHVGSAHGCYGHRGELWSAWFFQQGGGSLYDLGVYNVTFLTGLLGPAKRVVGMTGIGVPKRTVEGKEVTVEADDTTMLIIDHGDARFSHIQTGYTYFSSEAYEARNESRHTIEVLGTDGSMHLAGYDWAPHGVDVATLDNRKLTRFATDRGDYRWQGGAAHVAKCLATGETSLITPEHGLHVIEVMNACHESQRTGARIDIATTFRWPIVG